MKLGAQRKRRKVGERSGVARPSSRTLKSILKPAPARPTNRVHPSLELRLAECCRASELVSVQSLPKALDCEYEIVIRTPWLSLLLQFDGTVLSCPLECCWSWLKRFDPENDQQATAKLDQLLHLLQGERMHMLGPAGRACSSHRDPVVQELVELFRMYMLQADDFSEESLTCGIFDEDMESDDVLWSNLITPGAGASDLLSSLQASKKRGTQKNAHFSQQDGLLDRVLEDAQPPLQGDFIPRKDREIPLRDADVERQFCVDCDHITQKIVGVMLRNPLELLQTLFDFVLAVMVRSFRDTLSQNCDMDCPVVNDLFAMGAQRGPFLVQSLLVTKKLPAKILENMLAEAEAAILAELQLQVELQCGECADRHTVAHGNEQKCLVKDNQPAAESAMTEDTGECLLRAPTVGEQAVDAALAALENKSPSNDDKPLRRFTRYLTKVRRFFQANVERLKLTLPGRVVTKEAEILQSMTTFIRKLVPTAHWLDLGSSMGIEILRSVCVRENLQLNVISDPSLSIFHGRKSDLEALIHRDHLFVHRCPQKPRPRRNRTQHNTHTGPKLRRRIKK
jgi:hypothetical protein